MSDFLVIYLVLAIGIATLIIISALIKIRKERQESDEETEQEMEEHRRHMEQLSIDHTVNLTKLEIEVLEYYDICNIRIPTDIIEDLHHMKLDNEKDIFSFIESQRNYWKLENTKKVFRKGVK